MHEIIDRLERIEKAIAAILERQVNKEWYSTEEIARLLGRAEFTVREWARHGRIHAEKKISGRGKFQAWVISHQELEHIQREGLLPIGTANRE